MTQITFVNETGDRQVVEAEPGQTVMQVATRNGVPGIRAECGGACACATCHVYVEEDWLARTGTPDAMEEDMLEAADDVRPCSRLSCQITVTAELEGLTLRIPG